MPNGEDRALVARAREGEAAAFEDLIRPHAGRIYQTVLRITRNPADAADVYQEAMLAAYEKMGEFRGEAAFKSWLFRIAVNCALMHRRAEKRNPVMASEDIPLFNWMGGHAEPVRSFASSSEDAAQHSELRALLSEALNELPEVDRTIVWLKDVEGLSHADIAAATESTVLAVRSRLHRARLRLRQWLAGRVEDPS